MAKHEIINGVSYTPFIDPEFAKYEEKHRLILTNVLLSDLWDGARNKECTLDIPKLMRTSSVTLPSSEVLAKRDRCESKTRRKCNKYLKSLINWSELKRRGLVVGLKLKNQDIKNNKNLSSPPSQNNKNKNKTKEIKLDGEIRISSSSNGKKSRSPKTKDSSKSKSNDKKEGQKLNLNHKSDRKFGVSTKKSRKKSRSSSPSLSPPRKPSKFGTSSRKRSRSSSPSPSPPRKPSKFGTSSSRKRSRSSSPSPSPPRKPSKFGTSSSRKRSRSSSPSLSPPRKPSKSSKKIRVEEINNVVKKKQKHSSKYQHQHRASISNSYENKYKNFKIPRKQETPVVDLKKDFKRPKIISPIVTPSQTLPSTNNNASNHYKIPKISKKPAVESTGKGKIKVAIANLFEIDNKHFTPNWDTSDSDSSDDEKEKQIQLRPDPTLEQMSENPAYTSFGKYLARPETITERDKFNFPSSDDDDKAKAPLEVFEEVGQKVAAWVLKDLKPSEYPPFECPEFEEDSISTVSSGDDDIGGEVDETLSEDDCEISFMDNGWGDAAGNKSKKVPGNSGSDIKLIALEYCGRSLSMLDPQIGVNKRGVNNLKDKYFQILSVKPGSNYEKPTFQTKCMLCQVFCPNVYDLSSHLKTDLHRRNLLDYSFELATDEEKIFAEARDFDELKRAKREERRQERREYKAKYNTFSVPQGTIKPAFSLSNYNDNGQSTFSPPDAKRRRDFVEVIKL